MAMNANLRDFCLATALVLGLAGVVPGSADTQVTPSNPVDSIPDFKTADGNGDGHLSLAEFKALNLDDLAFHAADSDGDGSVSPGKYDRYAQARAADRAQTGMPAK